MNLDDFEQRLQRQPMRPPPADWRKQILSVAQAASSDFQKLPVSPAPTSWQTLHRATKALLWPAPRAWAGLVLIWLAILAVNHWSADEARGYALRTSGAPSELINAWKEQEQLLVELIGPSKSPVADRPKPVSPRPRSDRDSDWLMT